MILVKSSSASKGILVRNLYTLYISEAMMSIASLMFFVSSENITSGDCYKSQKDEEIKRGDPRKGRVMKSSKNPSWKGE